MAKSALKEADLYPPIKAFLEAQGYEVKGEIGACDVMARRGDEPAIVVELKLGFTLTLLLQGIERQSLIEHVYLAVPRAKRWPGSYRDILALCRRLGLGLLVVDGARVEAHLDPAPYQPKLRLKAQARLLREFQLREGDPEAGGSRSKTRMTAYRQQALRCALALREGPLKGAEVAKAAGVEQATRLMANNYYGWFLRPARGLYELTAAGRAALSESHPSPGSQPAP